METPIKTVSMVLNSPAPHQVGDGFLVSNFFPRGYKIKMSPFFLLDFNARMEFSATTHPRGVGVHPHRGFETVTIAYHGAIAHQDSAGNSGVIYPGDVQWMTAARGILHKEYHEAEFSKKGGPFQMVQLWVNLPAAYKMSTPKYQAIKHASIDQFILPNTAGKIEVIAGTYQNINGVATTFTELNVFNTYLNEDGIAYFNFPAHFNTGFLVIEGKVIINDTEIAEEGQFIHFKNEGEKIKVKASVQSVILILSGVPINEPIAQYGPFLMNTQQEIKEAITDYNEGRFGYLEE